MKGYEYLLTQAVRVIAKPQIDERIQQRYMSPSAPNIPEAQLWFDLFYSYEPSITRPSTARFPDGLGDLVGY